MAKPKKRPTTKRAPLPSPPPKAKRPKALPSPPPVLADRTHDALYAEALRRAREVVSEAEALVASLGQWLFANLFAGKTDAVLDRDPDHPVWQQLSEAANGHTLSIARATLNTTLRVAALDKRLSDGSWAHLPYSHKVALLPLREPTLLREGARHVQSGSLSVRETRIYVTNTLVPENAQLRLTPRQAKGVIHKFSTTLDRKGFFSKLESQITKLKGDDRQQTADEIDALVERLTKLRAKLD